jgi:hypothetical protein
LRVPLDPFADLLAVALVGDIKSVKIFGRDLISGAVDELEASLEVLYKGVNTALHAVCQCSFLVIFLFAFTFYAGAVLSCQRFPLLFFFA